jgi:hypothetical protein
VSSGALHTVQCRYLENLVNSSQLFSVLYSMKRGVVLPTEKEWYDSTQNHEYSFVKTKLKIKKAICYDPDRSIKINDTIKISWYNYLFLFKIKLN